MGFDHIGADITPRQPADPFDDPFHGREGFFERFRIKGLDLRHGGQFFLVGVISGQQLDGGLNQSIGCHEKRFEEIVQMAVTLTRDIIYDEIFQIGTGIPFEKAVDTKA
jgi:hypothetical protein